MAALSPHRDLSGRKSCSPRSSAKRVSSRRSSRLAETPPAAAKVLTPKMKEKIRKILK